MNRIYKVIWSKVKNQYVVVSELAHSNGKQSRTGKNSLRSRIAALVVCGAIAAFGLYGNSIAYADTGDGTTASAGQYVAIGEASYTQAENYNRWEGYNPNKTYTRVIDGHTYVYTETTAGNFWVREGYTIKIANDQRFPGTNNGISTVVEAYKGEGADTSGIVQSYQNVQKDMGITTLNGDNLNSTSTNMYVGAVNTPTTGITSADNRFYIQVKQNGRDTWINAGGDSGGQYRSYFNYQDVTYDSTTGLYSFKGQIVNTENLYSIDGNVGVFTTTAGGNEIYTGDVYGWNNEILVTGVDENGNYISYWGAENVDPNAPIGNMPMSTLQGKFDVVDENIKALHRDDIKEIQLGTVTNGGTINLATNGGEDIPGKITVTSLHGNDGDDVQIQFANEDTDGTSHSFTVNAGSKVVGTVTGKETAAEGDTLDGISINGVDYKLGGGTTYTKGDGIAINSNEISVDLAKDGGKNNISGLHFAQNGGLANNLSVIADPNDTEDNHSDGGNWTIEDTAQAGTTFKNTTLSSTVTSSEEVTNDKKPDEEGFVSYGKNQTITDTDGNKATITDVASADTLKDIDINKIGDLQYNNIFEGDSDDTSIVKNGDKVTVAIGKLDNSVTNLTSTVNEGWTASAGNVDIPVNPTEDKDGNKQNKLNFSGDNNISVTANTDDRAIEVALNPDIEVDSVTAGKTVSDGTVTNAGTVINGSGLTTGKISITGGNTNQITGLSNTTWRTDKTWQDQNVKADRAATEGQLLAVEKSDFYLQNGETDLGLGEDDEGKPITIGGQTTGYKANKDGNIDMIVANEKGEQKHVILTDIASKEKQDQMAQQLDGAVMYDSTYDEGNFTGYDKGSVTLGGGESVYNYDDNNPTASGGTKLTNVAYAETETGEGHNYDGSAAVNVDLLKNYVDENGGGSWELTTNGGTGTGNEAVSIGKGDTVNFANTDGNVNVSKTEIKDKETDNVIRTNVNFDLNDTVKIGGDRSTAVTIDGTNGNIDSQTTGNWNYSMTSTQTGETVNYKASKQLSFNESLGLVVTEKVTDSGTAQRADNSTEIRGGEIYVRGGDGTSLHIDGINKAVTGLSNTTWDEDVKQAVAESINGIDKTEATKAATQAQLLGLDDRAVKYDLTTDKDGNTVVDHDNITLDSDTEYKVTKGEDGSKTYSGGTRITNVAYANVNDENTGSDAVNVDLLKDYVDENGGGAWKLTTNGGEAEADKFVSVGKGDTVDFSGVKRTVGEQQTTESNIVVNKTTDKETGKTNVTFDLGENLDVKNITAQNMTVENTTNEDNSVVNVKYLKANDFYLRNGNVDLGTDAEGNQIKSESGQTAGYKADANGNIDMTVVANDNETKKHVVLTDIASKAVQDQLVDGAVMYNQKGDGSYDKGSVTLGGGEFEYSNKNGGTVLNNVAYATTSTDDARYDGSAAVNVDLLKDYVGTNASYTADDGIDISTDRKISVNAGNGLTFEEAPGEPTTELAVKAGQGIYVDGNGVNAKLGGGLEVNENNAIQVNTGRGLTINTENGVNNVEANLGEGLTFNDDKQIKVNYGDGLELVGEKLQAKAGANVTIDENGISAKNTTLVNGEIKPTTSAAGENTYEIKDTDGNTATISDVASFSKLQEVAGDAAKHNTVKLAQGESNLTLDDSGKNEAGGIQYTVGLSKDLSVNSVTAGGDNGTVINTTGLSVGGKTYVTNKGLDANDQKITGVADGTLGEGSQDAINGSQLYATNQNVTQNTTDITKLKTGWVAQVNGAEAKIVNPDSNTLNFVDGDYTKVTAENGNIKISTDLSSLKAEDTNAVLYDNAQKSSVTLGGTGAGTPVKLTNVATGEAPTDAVNVSQLEDYVADNATYTSGQGINIDNNNKVSVKKGDGLAFGENDELIVKQGEGVTVDKNGVSVNAAGGLTVDDNNVVVNTGANLSVVDGKLAVDDAIKLSKTGSLTVGDKTYVTSSGLNANDQNVVNVAPGTISEDSKDAINGSQLYATNQNVTQNTTDITKLKTDVNAGWVAQVNGAEAKTVNPDSNTLNFVDGDYTKVTAENGNIKISTDLSNLKAEDTNAVLYDNAQKSSVTLGGTGAGTPVKLTNVATGEAPTDAVNVSQLEDYVADNATYTSGQGINIDNNNKVSVKKGDGLAFGENDELIVKQGEGVTVDKNGVSVNAAGGLTVDDNNVVVNTGANLSVVDGKLAVDDAIKLSKTGSLTVGDKTYVTSSGLNANDQNVVNVAPGTISEDSKDAINGSQLYATNQNVEQNTTDITKLKTDVNAGWVAQVNGAEAKTVNPDSNTLNFVDGDYTKVTAENGNIKISTDLSNLKAEDTNAVLYDNAQKSSVTLGGTGAGTPVKLTNVAAGEAPTDAVNVSQLEDYVADNATYTAGQGINIDNNNKVSVKKGDGLDFGENDELIVKQGEGVTVDKNGVSVNAAGGLTIDDNNVVVNTGANLSVVDGKLAVDDAIKLSKTGSLTVGDKTYVTSSGLNANDQNVINVAPGTISEDSKDAINGSQLYATNQNVEQNTTDITKLKTGWVAQVNGAEAKTVNPDSNTLNFVDGDYTKVTAENGNIKISTDLSNLKAEDTNAVLYDNAQKSSVTLGGTGAGTPVKLTNVATGEAPTDAVNVSQLEEYVADNATYTAGQGINIDNNNKVSVKKGDGLAFGENDELIVKQGEGVTVDNNGVSVNTGNGLTVDDNNVIVNAGDNLRFTNDGKLTLEKDINLGDAGSLTTGNVVISNDSIKVGGNTYITSAGINANDQQIKSVAAGTLDTDAVNVSQLKDAIEGTYGGWYISAEGTNPTLVEDGKTVDFSNNDGNIKISQDGTNLVFDLNSSLAVGDNITLNGDTGDASFGKVNISGYNGTISGLTNTTWNSVNDYSSSTQAATEAQLQQAVNEAKTDMSNSDKALVSGAGQKGQLGEYNQVTENGDVNLRVENASGEGYDVIIKDVASATDLGDVDKLGDLAKGEDGTTNVVNAVENVDNKIGDLQYKHDDGTGLNYVTAGDSVTGAIGDLDAAIKNAATEAGKHSTVSGGNNINVTSSENTDGSTNYQVSLKDDITLGNTNGNNVSLSGTNGTISATGNISAGSFTSGSISINSGNSGTIGGLSNKTWDFSHDYSQSGQAATEAQLHAVSEGSVQYDRKEDGTVNKGSITLGDGEKGTVIHNVAPGTEATDAATVGQVVQMANTGYDAINNMGSQINRLSDRIDKVGAGAAALAALHPLDFDPDDKLSFAAGYGNYAGENAVAVGAFYQPNEDTMFSIGGTFGNDENMVNAGVSFKFGQKNNVSRSRVSMAKELVALRDEVAQLKALMAHSGVLPADGQLDTSALFPDVPENHWAYEYVHELAKLGIVEGYPDGNFDGDRMMTRYEFAAIVYRAMQKGVNVDRRMLTEFEPELKLIRVDVVAKDRNGNPTIERVRVNEEATQQA